MSGPLTVSGMGTGVGLVRAGNDAGFGQVMQGQGTGTNQGTSGQTNLTASTSTGGGTLVGTGGLQGTSLVGTGQGTLVAQTQGTGTAALREMSVPDANANGIYELSDRQGVRTPTVRELATAIRDSGANVVLVGEIHPPDIGGAGSIQSNPNFWALAEEVRKQGRGEGQKVLLAVEQQASSEQQDLLRKLNSGRMTPGVFELEWAEAAAENHRRVGGPDRPAWAWQSEARDITTARERGFMVAYIDPNRFGGDRERGMARAIERESEAYGDNVITLARVGGAHAALERVTDSGEIELEGWKKPVVASNWDNPAGRILNEGDDAGTLSIMIDRNESRSIANPDAPSYGVIRPVPHGAWEFILPGLTQ